MEKLKELLHELNKEAVNFGLPQIELVNPKDCKGQEKNARYFSPEVFKQLVENIKNDGRFESIPLCYRDDEGTIKIISGHHRIEAAREAGLEYILVFMITPKDRDEIIFKQLSHNSLVGKDDKTMLFELFNEIKSMEAKIASGVKSEVEKVDYTSLNFSIGTFRQFVLLFAQDEPERFDRVMTELKEKFTCDKEADVHIVSDKNFDRMADSIRTIKKAHNIKNNAVAFDMMLDIVEEWINQNTAKNE